VRFARSAACTAASNASSISARWSASDGAQCLGVGDLQVRRLDTVRPLLQGASPLGTSLAHSRERPLRNPERAVMARMLDDLPYLVNTY
jgi:hypothetical protein